MKIKWMIVMTVGLLATGCTTVHRGVVAMKISETQAHVCLSKGEVGVGESVKLYRNICAHASKSVLSRCEKRLIGTGTVSEILNEHYSVVAMERGADFKEGDFVESGK